MYLLAWGQQDSSEGKGPCSAGWHLYPDRKGRKKSCPLTSTDADTGAHTPPTQRSEFQIVGTGQP